MSLGLYCVMFVGTIDANGAPDSLLFTRNNAEYVEKPDETQVASAIALLTNALGEDAILLEKVTFGAADLPKVIGKRRKIEEFQLIGVCTDICVISNAMILKAAFPEVPIKIISECCAGVSPESHANALSAMAVCQMEIV